MAETITATYRDGAFVPDGPVNVAAGTRVRLTVEADDATMDQRQPATTERPAGASPSEGLGRFLQRADQVQLRSGLRMTRDELHERD